MPSFQPFSVFVTDDDPLMREMLMEFMTRKFPTAQVTLLSTGEELLRRLDEKPALIILDYQLDSVQPGVMNGLQVMKQIHEDAPAIPVIFLSIQESTDIAANTIKYGAYDYIAKNTHAFDRLEIIMNNALGRSALKKDLASQKIMNAVFMLVLVVLAAALIYSRFKS